MTRRVFVRFALVVCLAAAGIGCDESLSDIAGPTPDLEPTFSSIQQFIFESTDSSGRTACTQCHNRARLPIVPMSLEHADAYAALVGAASTLKPGAVRVIPGNPENSYLIHKLEGRSGIVGLRMPRNTGPFLTEGQIAIIERWIELGAPNN